VLDDKVSEELEGMWKETIMTNFKILLSIYPRNRWISGKSSKKTNRSQGEIRNRSLWMFIIRLTIYELCHVNQQRPCFCNTAAIIMLYFRLTLHSNKRIVKLFLRESQTLEVPEQVSEPGLRFWIIYRNQRSEYKF
jgi:hypothetical protein